MILLFVPAGIFLADAWIKNTIDKTKKEGQQEKICGGRLILQKYYNKGAALNFLADRPKLMTMLHTVILSVVAVVYAALFRTRENNGLKLSLGMILGGGLSNLYDRYTKKHVIDYVSFHVKNKRLRNIIFNISDFFIFAGALLTVIISIKKES